MSEPRKCPKCGNTNLWKCGIFPTVKRGKLQRWKCKECGVTFYG